MVRIGSGSLRCAEESLSIFVLSSGPVNALGTRGRHASLAMPSGISRDAKLQSLNHRPLTEADMTKALDAIRGLAHFFTAGWVRSGSVGMESGSHEPVCILEVLPVAESHA